MSAFSQHTFSICAVDTITGEVGSAGASCIEESSMISDVHPGVGVIHTQAAYQKLNQDVGRNLMNAGLTPQEIIDSLVAGDFIFGAPNRQYGAVGIYNGSPLAAGYTGTSCIDYKNHMVGRYYTIQGNILLGQAILDSMESKFLHTDGDLACRLMAAMQGAKVVGADTRCAGNGTSSLSSFLRVALPGDDPETPYINIIIDTVRAGQEPIDTLQTRFDQIKNCPSDTTSSGTMPHAPHITVQMTNSGAQSIITINSALDNFRFELFDSSGRQLLNKNLTGFKVQYMSVSQLPKGIYLWRILSKGNVYNGKLFTDGR